MNAIDFFQAKINNTIAPRELMLEYEKEPSKFFILDVRVGEPSFKNVKVKNAVEIPLNELADRLSEVPKDKLIIIYCWNPECNMSAKAALILLKNGYTNLKEMSGGLSAWVGMGFKVVGC